MIYLSERQNLIIRELVNNEYKIKKDILISKINISLKTLKSDIIKINLVIKEFDSQILLEKENIEFKTLYNPTHWISILKLNQRINDLDLIKINLIKKKEVFTLNDFAIELFISKSKIEKIIANINFNFLQIKKVRNRGIQIIGDDLLRINEFVEIFQKYIDNVNYLVSIRVLIKQIYHEDMNITDFQNLVNKHNKYINDNNIINDNYIRQSFIVLIFLYKEKLDEGLYIKYMNQFQTLAKFQFEEKIKLIINDIFEINNIIYNLESKTYKMLLLHIEAALNQKVQNKGLQNKLINDIKIRFPFAYWLAEELITKLKMENMYLKNIDEKYYLTIYIQTLINNSFEDKRIQINVVCQYGMSFSNYIVLKLEKLLAKDVVINNYSLYKFLNLKTKGEIVVTTIPNLEGEDSIYINPIPSDLEIQNLIIKIKNKITQQKIDQLINKKIFKIIKQNDMLEILDIIKMDLNKNNLVKKNYFQTLTTRLKQGLVNVNNTIILHGDAKEVIDSQLFIYNLENKVEYANNDVKIIFVLVLTENYLKYNNHIIHNFYKLILDKNLIEILEKTQSMNQFKYILNTKLIKENKN